MKVLLLNPRSPDPAPSYFGPPYGLSLLSAILKARGTAVVGRDYDRVGQAEMLEDAAEFVRAEKPDLAGVSCQSSNRGPAAELVRRLKSASPGLKVVVGGPFATAEPEAALRRTGADWAAIGDGEETLPELVDALARGADAREIAGLAWLEGGALRRALAREAFANLDALPHPDFELFDARASLRRHARPRALKLAGALGADGRRSTAVHSALLVLSSRGCVYRCVFCPMSTVKGAPRLHAPSYFADMVADMSRRYGCREFVFGDNFFTRDRARVLEICRQLRRRAPGVEWICMTRADAMDAELARAMAAAGCREISYGVETGSARVQKAIGKRLDLARVPEAFAVTRAAGMHAVLMLMVGNPGDDLEAAGETADFLRGVEPDRVLVHTTKVYPGTAIHARALKAGVIAPGFYDGDDHRAPVYTVERTAAELEEMRAQLPSRVLFVESGRGCVNGCCSLRRASPGPRRLLNAALAQAALRSERAVLGGGDALLTPELGRVHDDAAALGLHDLSLYTTARPLADDRLAARLRESRDLRRVIVPLFSPEASRHDARARVPGALLQTKLGIRRWLRRGGEVEAWLVPGPEEISRLDAWIGRLAADGVREALLIHREPPPGWGGLPLEECPRLGLFAAAAAAAARSARSAGLRLSVYGLPPCLWDEDLGARHERRSLYDEVSTGAAAPVSCRARREPRLSFARDCAGCSRRGACDGVWSDYLARHGAEELHAR